MADAYPYALLVELEGSNTAKLRNKLVKYFQSKKANGGECEVDYETGRATAVLRFRHEEDRENVLRKETHQLSLGTGVLRMRVAPLADGKATPGKPPDDVSEKSGVAGNKQLSADEQTPDAKVQTEAKGKGDDTADEGVGSTSAVLENIPENLGPEFLEMLVENISKDPDSPTTSQRFTLEVIPEFSLTVVTFQSEKENSDFLTKCPQNRTFKKKGLSVRPLEVTEQVWVEKIQPFNEDMLHLYFENEGMDVESIVFHEVEESALITFKDHKAVEKVLKKKHYITQEEIRVYPFHKSLGTALYGKDRPKLTLPAAIYEPIDSVLWRYLNGKQSAADTVRSDLAKHLCGVNLQQPSTACLSPISSLLKQKNAKALIKGWTEAVKSAFEQALSTFKVLKFSLEIEALEEAEETIRKMILSEDVVVIPDKENGILSVVGFLDDVNRLELTLGEAVTELVKIVQRKKLSITQDLKMAHSIFHILCLEGLLDKVLHKFPELKLSFRKESQALTVTGFREEILPATEIVYSEVFKLKRRNLEADKFVLSLFKDEHQEELTNLLLTSNGIKAALEINTEHTESRVQLLAMSDSVLNDAEGYLCELLKSQYIDVEDSSVLKKQEWQHLISQMEDANKTFVRKIRIQTTGQQVVVSGHKDIVFKVGSELDEFLKQNSQVQEVVAVKPNIKVEYVRKHKTSWFEQVKDNVVVSYQKEAICVSGSRANVADCKALIDDSVSSVVFGTLKISKPGVKTFFQDKETMYVHSLMNETGCLVQLIDETGDGQDDAAFRGSGKPVYQLQTSDGVEIAVCKDDLCSYPVHAVVNASNEDLQHSGGLSAALLNAAGPQLQDECNKVVKLGGQLKPGDCVMTGAGGRLCCKILIHAVGPMYDHAKPQKAVAQLRRAVKGSLDLAEKHGCVSVALPAISRSLGFSLGLCATTIVKAVKEHCEDSYDVSTLKAIHLVNNDDAAVQAMEAAVRQEFGNQGASHSPQTGAKATKSKPWKHVSLDPNCLDQWMTNDGMRVTLMKGNIEDARTDVIVNTVAEDLALNKGAVSHAILGVAGSKLQDLIYAKSTSGNLGDVIETAGCRLKCKAVFHAVAPHWDNGQGTGEKILRLIFKECLTKAEGSGLTSISFPAIATGNLGFPKDLAASVMLDEILAFSSTKKPKHLKKIKIVLFSGDTQTIQVFSDEFKKRIPKASAGPVPSKTPQTSGPFSKIISGSGMHETKVRGVTLQVATGDITKETSDVIVNSSNEKFNLKSGVSKAVLDAAGPAVEAECQRLGAQQNPGIIMTQPGNLKCKKILHLVGKTDPVKLNKIVKEALEMCSQSMYTSVSFPAIGTGQGNVQAQKVADAMFDAVTDVLSANPSTTLKTIRIVIFQAPMLADFHKSMLQREATQPKSQAGFFGNIGSKIKSLFMGGSPETQWAEGDLIIEALEVDPACFHICGDTQSRVDFAKQWITDLISKEYHSFTITDNTILSFSTADYQHITDIQRSMAVSIKVEIKNDQASLAIEGLSRDVLKASDEIHRMLKRTRDEEELKRKVTLAGTVADWQYQLPGSQFQSFDAMTNFQLEQALQNQQHDVKVKLQGKDYDVTMPQGPASDNQGQTIEIKRIDKLKDEDVPHHWDAMPPNTSYHCVTLKAGTSEYNDVLKLFQATCKLAVTKIERIQNPVLWKSLQIKKREMERRNGHQNNERRLFHGTCSTSLAVINQDGFNRSYAGKNAACYGNGTYFAINASYSASHTYSPPNAKGEKCMYLCSVLTGDYTAGKQNIIVPPAKGPVSTQRYDSVVDNSSQPSMFVIFHDTQAYPEYLITFK